MQADQLVTWRNPEMLPSLISLHIVVYFVPLLVEKELARLVNKTHALNVTALIVLADIYIGHPFSITEHMLDILLLACLTGTHKWRRNVVGKVHSQAIQVLACTNLDSNEPNLFL